MEQQLLKITNIPIEYQYQIERGRLERSTQGELSFDIERRPSKMQIKTEDVKIRMDTVAMRRSMGLMSARDSIGDAAQRGKQSAMDATAQYAEDGNQMARGMAQGSDIAKIMADRLFQQPTTTTAYLPSVGPVITWQPNSIQMKFDPGDVNFDWQMMRNTMDYVPGKFQMQILQYPKVSIEYLGDPNYVPPSSDPNYQE